MLTKILFIDSRPSPGLTLNLSSNNPFRNRAASPLSASGQLSPAPPSPAARPISTNPFLDSSSITLHQPVVSPDKMSFSPDATAPPRPALTGNAADLFVRQINPFPTRPDPLLECECQLLDCQNVTFSFADIIHAGQPHSR